MDELLTDLGQRLGRAVALAQSGQITELELLTTSIQAVDFGSHAVEQMAWHEAFCGLVGMAKDLDYADEKVREHEAEYKTEVGDLKDDLQYANREIKRLQEEVEELQYANREIKRLQEEVEELQLDRMELRKLKDQLEREEEEAFERGG